MTCSIGTQDSVRIVSHILRPSSLITSGSETLPSCASQASGQMVRLSTEAEWEYACRAGTKTAFYTGDTEADLDRAGWYGKNSNNTTHPVGQKIPNAWGEYDMHGNVWEWCADWYGDYIAGAATDPQGPTQGQYRVLRGGSWGDIRGACRSAERYCRSPLCRLYFYGFRVAADVPSKAP